MEKLRRKKKKKRQGEARAWTVPVTIETMRLNHQRGSRKHKGASETDGSIPILTRYIPW
jgi:hypothetical protein